MDLDGICKPWQHQLARKVAGQFFGDVSVKLSPLYHMYNLNINYIFTESWTCQTYSKIACFKNGVKTAGSGRKQHWFEIWNEPFENRTAATCHVSTRGFTTNKSNDKSNRTTNKTIRIIITIIK